MPIRSNSGKKVGGVPQGGLGRARVGGVKGVITRPRTTPQKTNVNVGSFSSGSLLSEISTDPIQGARSIVLLGEAGCGKSSLASCFPNPVFLCDAQDIGVNDLRAKGLVSPTTPVFPPMTDWETILRAVHEIATDSHSFETLVVEGIVGFEQLCFEYVLRVEFNGDWKEYLNFYTGPRKARESVWPDFIARLQTVRERNIHVILTGHTHKKMVPSPETKDYMGEIPYSDPELFQYTKRWAENVLFMSYTPEIIDPTKKQLKYKAASGHRFLVCTETPYQSAKNRLGIQESIPCGENAAETYERFCEAAGLDPATAMNVGPAKKVKREEEVPF